MGKRLQLIISISIFLYGSFAGATITLAFLGNPAAIPCAFIAMPFGLMANLANLEQRLISEVKISTDAILSRETSEGE